VNSFELNKIALALLLTVLVIFGISDLSKVIFKEEALTSNAYPIMVETTSETAAPVEVVEGPSLPDLLAVASVDKGANVFKKCKACHTTDNGGKNLVGPNLWDIVGYAKGARDGFAFSSALTAVGGEWTYEDLDAFLKKPSKFVPKTKMSFAGLKKTSDRANVILYLRALSDTPVDLPAITVPPAEEAPEETEDILEDALPSEVLEEAPQE